MKKTYKLYLLSLSFIITLNIQPTYYYDFWGGYDLEDVAVRDSCKCY